MLKNYKFRSKHITAPEELNGDEDDEIIKLVVKGQVITLFVQDVVAMSAFLNIDAEDIQTHRYNQHLNEIE